MRVDDDAAEEREQVAPALEDDERDEQHEWRRRTASSPIRCGRSARGHVGQPVGAQLGELAQHDGVDLVGEAAGPRRRAGRRSSRPRAARGRRAIPGRVRPRLRGSGGGAPDGRRRRRRLRDRRTVPPRSGRVAGRCTVGARLHRRRHDDARPSQAAATVAGARPAGHVGVELRGGSRSSASPTTASITSTSAGPPPVDDLGADERRDVLGRLQAAVVGQLDEVAAGRSRDRS